MKVDHRYMSTEGLIRSYHIAATSRNYALVEEIKGILAARGETDKIPSRILPVKVDQSKNSWKLDDW